MRYKRTFILQACHFNGLGEYELYWNSAELTHAECLVLLKGTHGHNFKIEIEVTKAFDQGAMRTSDGWLIDDIALEAFVREWDNTNLSVHKDFACIRATTENMAIILHRKLKKEFKTCVFVVRIFERDDVSAEAHTSIGDI
jgi:6-pyruvoyl-tetrahydropterin synthase